MTKRISRHRRKLMQRHLPLSELRWSRESLVRRWRAQRRLDGVLAENWLIDCVRGGYMQLTLRVGKRTLRRMLTQAETDALIYMLAVRISDADSGQSFEEGLAAALRRHWEAAHGAAAEAALVAFFRDAEAAHD